ncbi:MAG: TIGR01777 family protein [Elusimicrobia bacterium]|nr:TIGR01777 family protein [Elusimicrobiota bacterium]
MRILVAGATGFIGSEVCRALAKKGHTITNLTRTPKPSWPTDGASLFWDARNPGEWAQHLPQYHAVLNFCGEPIVKGRWTPARKKLLHESRILSTRALVEAIRRASPRPKVLINASAIGYYGDRAEEVLIENSLPGRSFLAELCRDWEGEAQKAETLGIRVIRLRIGVVLGKEGGALTRMLLPFRLGLGGPLGSGRQWMSWIERKELADLAVYLLEEERASGAFNATSPMPVPNREFARTLAQILRRPCFFSVPAPLLKLLLGEMSCVLLDSQKVLPQKAQEIGYSFSQPRLSCALQACLKKFPLEKF